MLAGQNGSDLRVDLVLAGQQLLGAKLVDSLLRSVQLEHFTDSKLLLMQQLLGLVHGRLTLMDMTEEWQLANLHVMVNVFECFRGNLVRFRVVLGHALLMPD